MSTIMENRGLEKPMPHPILDNSSKIMRFIANPVYDRLTVSRAANVRKYGDKTSTLQVPQLVRSRAGTASSGCQLSDVEETTITPLPDLQEVSENRLRSKSVHNVAIPPGLRLPTEVPGNRSRSKSVYSVAVPPALRLPSATPSSNQRLARSVTPGARSRISTARSRVSTARSRASTGRQRPSTARPRAKSAHLTVQSIQDELVADTANLPNPIPAGTTRYVNSRHGFEVQHYSSPNWLLTDVYTKETCQEHETIFREMLEKKRYYERLSRSIYSSEYYSQRWHELLQSFKQGHLTHTEWAQQNYQLFFLKTLYTQALEREQLERDNSETDIETDIYAQNILDKPADTKHDENTEHAHVRLNTGHSRNTLEEASFLSNNSLAFPMSNTTDETYAPSPEKPRLLSISTNDDGEYPRPTTYQPVIRSKPASVITPSLIKSKALYLLDEQRWSLQAMVKRVVGLADALPATPKFTDRRQSFMTTTNTECNMEQIS